VYESIRPPVLDSFIGKNLERTMKAD